MCDLFPLAANCTCENQKDDMHCGACGEANPKSMHSSWGADVEDESGLDDGLDAAAVLVDGKWFCLNCTVYAKHDESLVTCMHIVMSSDDG